MADKYSKEDVEIIAKIQRASNYYEIVGVSRTATDDEIKKAYRKLSVKVHPDKNRAPGANEAFQALGNAAAVLSDKQKRREYDTKGFNRTHTRREYSRSSSSRSSTFGGGGGGGNSGGGYAYSDGCHSDISAEEFFAKMFSEMASTFDTSITATTTTSNVLNNQNINRFLQFIIFSSFITLTSSIYIKEEAELERTVLMIISSVQFGILCAIWILRQQSNKLETIQANS